MSHNAPSLDHLRSSNLNDFLKNQSQQLKASPLFQAGALPRDRLPLPVWLAGKLDDTRLGAPDDGEDLTSVHGRSSACSWEPKRGQLVTPAVNRRSFPAGSHASGGPVPGRPGNEDARRSAFERRYGPTGRGLKFEDSVAGSHPQTSPSSPGTLSRGHSSPQLSPAASQTVRAPFNDLSRRPAGIGQEPEKASLWQQSLPIPEQLPRGDSAPQLPKAAFVSSASMTSLSGFGRQPAGNSLTMLGKGSHSHWWATEGPSRSGSKPAGVRNSDWCHGFDTMAAKSHSNMSCKYPRGAYCVKPKAVDWW